MLVKFYTSLCMFNYSGQVCATTTYIETNILGYMYSSALQT